MQLVLREGIYQPLPAGLCHYVPVLQNKAGELEALTRLPDQDWARITPVICMVGPKTPPATLSDNAIRDWTRKVKDATREHAFYLDMVRLSPSMPVSTQGGVTAASISVLHDRLRKRGAEFIPVYRTRWASPTAATAVRDAHDNDGRGAGLRVQLEAMAGETPVAIARRAAQDLEMDPQEIDLMVDLGYLDWDTDPDVDGLGDVVRALRQDAPWRNIVMMSTTIPSSFSKSVAPTGSVTLLPRHEKTVYAGLRVRLKADCPIYGDFGVQHPDPPTEGGGPGMRANVRYTTDNGVLVARGRSPVVEVGNIEYPDICRALTENRHFSGPSFSWGDGTIADCAHGLLAPGGSEMWRAAGTSHHLQHVLQELESSGS